MGCWFLICFVLKYPNKQVPFCVYVNNSPTAVEKTMVYYIKELKFKKELRNSRIRDKGWYLLHAIGIPSNCKVEINRIS